MSPGLDVVRDKMHASQLAAETVTLGREEDGSLLFGAETRSLRPEEIEQLKRQGNRAEDWAYIRVHPQFSATCIWHCEFFGRCALGVFTGRPLDLGDAVSMPSGLRDCTLGDLVEIGHEAAVHRVGFIGRSIVQDSAAVVGCGSITGSGRTTFGCGRELSLGVETGGREVKAFGELTVGIAAQLATDRGNQALLAEYDELIGDYLRRVESRGTIVGRSAVLRDTGQVANCYIGPFAMVSNAGRLADSCLLSSNGEPTSIRDGACLEHAVVQWGATIGSMSVVLDSVVCEHSQVGRHAKLVSSLLGPNSVFKAGEIISSLVGPFVSFHHQALLIAALWPEGKGNIGYGANIGSNHTGRAPDQEIWCGEGTFFGLGINVKYPANYVKSPFSILASGITCLPQKVEFPFSLINSPSTRFSELSPLYNEIFPAWVLRENVYMLKRNEAKYRQRNRARREPFDFAVFRPEIVALMQAARERLAKARGRPFFTSREIPGLGKNYVTEPAVQAAVEAYDFHLGCYARRGLLEQLARRDLGANSTEAARLLEEPSDDARWEQQRGLLAKESGEHGVSRLLDELLEREQLIAQQVERTKAKDDARGQRVIPDYESVHAPTADDALINETWREYERLVAAVQERLA